MSYQTSNNTNYKLCVHFFQPILSVASEAAAGIYSMCNGSLTSLIGLNIVKKCNNGLETFENYNVQNMHQVQICNTTKCQDPFNIYEYKTPSTIQVY